MTAEHERLEHDRLGHENWRLWGPYVSDRQWGTVREDYSANGDAWTYLPHEYARSHAYRWSEDGIAGVCDQKQKFCIALALWNGKDPILKERLFGLTNGQGNHGEDVKELYYYLDATPTHSYLKMLYKYPQREYPYAELVEVKRQTEPRRTGIRTARHRHFQTIIAISMSLSSTPKPGRTELAHAGNGSQSRAGSGGAAFTPHVLVPQHLGMGDRERKSQRRRKSGRQIAVASGAREMHGLHVDGECRRCSSPRTRRTHRVCSHS